MSLAAIGERVGLLLRRAAGAGRVSPSNSSLNREYVRAIAHFELFTLHTLGAPITQHLVRKEVLPLVFKVRTNPLSLLKELGACFFLWGNRANSRSEVSTSDARYDRVVPYTSSTPRTLVSAAKVVKVTPLATGRNSISAGAELTQCPGR
jgi:hypothetical protein